MNIAVWLVLLGLIIQSSSERSFTVDHKNNCFLKDGNPFRYISGSIHYFRVLSDCWADRLEKMRAAGLNALQTYVEWNQHEPESGQYDFTGNKDLPGFLFLAEKLGFLVILRIGPYIDAEREMGGLPYWLLRMKPSMKLRTSDPDYVRYVDRWFAVLLPIIKPFLYANGGPVIMVQVENEYGSWSSCDFAYTAHLRDLIRQELNNVLLFTTDGSADSLLMCGKVDSVYSTIDFGSGTNVTAVFNTQRLHQSTGPLVNSEYYAGWLDHWGEPHANISTSAVCKTLDDILSANASVNVYMFHGGTSFGFANGANLGSTYQACPTSYDYDAPLSEAGDPTEKYYAVRSVIGKHTQLPPGPVPIPSPKMAIEVQLQKVASIWTLLQFSSSVNTTYPVSFEDIKQPYGFVLYETSVPFLTSDPAVLTVSGLRDRGHVFVDRKFQGILSREQNIYTMPLKIQPSQKLQILVENQGRVCFGSGLADRKGIIQNVTIGPKTLVNWTITPINLSPEVLNQLNDIASELRDGENSLQPPTVYTGNFVLTVSQALDTFLNMVGWHKGVAFLNGFNLGRYWPIVGPQVTLYVPSSLFHPHPQPNNIVILELEHSPCQAVTEGCTLKFVKNPVINGTTPYSSSRFCQSLAPTRGNF